MPPHKLPNCLKRKLVVVQRVPGEAGPTLHARSIASGVAVPNATLDISIYFVPICGIFVSEPAVLKDNLGAARDIVILGAILLFSSGWLTTFFYLEHFGISLNALDWAIYSFYLYSLVPLTHAWRTMWNGWLPAVLLVVFVSTTWLYLTFPPWRAGVVGAFILALLLVLVPLCREAAIAEATCARYGGGSRSIYLSLDISKLELKGDKRSAEEVGALVKAIADNGATLLAETPDFYFILIQPNFRDARNSGNFVRAPVFRVPSAAVLFARTTAPALPSTSSNSKELCYETA